MPKVSVITPVYNGELYIESAIVSLLAQTFQDWELIVVDDGSTDSTPIILERFIDKRIKIFRQENSGEAHARNVGLENAAGEYIAFLDADDLYLPNALQDFTSFLDLHLEFGVVYSDGIICDSNEVPLIRLDEIRSSTDSGNLLDLIVISSSVVTVPICTMSRASIIREHSICFDRKLTIGPDWDFWIQMAVHVGFGHLPKATCKYRVHQVNITKTTKSDKRKKDRIYSRMKIMNSNWFQDLSLRTREIFLLDFLVNLASGNSDAQRSILQSKQFDAMPAGSRAYLWRLLGIDVLQVNRDRELAQLYFRQAIHLHTHDYKARFLLGMLALGTPVALATINFWRYLLSLYKRITSQEIASSQMLQKLFGLAE